MKKNALLWTVRVVVFLVVFSLVVYVIRWFFYDPFSGVSSVIYGIGVLVAIVIAFIVAEKINFTSKQKRKELEIKGENDRIQYAQLLKEPEAQLNSKPCPHCGKMHKVELYPEADGYTFPIYENDDACKPFRKDVNTVIKKINADWKNREAIWEALSQKIPSRQN